MAVTLVNAVAGIPSSGGAAPVTTVTVDTVGGTPFGSESGSTCLRFANLTDDSGGSDISYSDDATTGNKFTIHTAGTYAISFTVESQVNEAVVAVIGKNLNLSDRASANIADLAPTKRLAFEYLGAISGVLGMVNVGVTVVLAVNDVITFSTFAGNAFNSNRAQATITRTA